jgi:hypothetical protein
MIGNDFLQFKFYSQSVNFCRLIMFFVARMILDYAAKNGGIVVSRDNYRDLMRVGIRTMSTRTNAAFVTVQKCSSCNELRRYLVLR